MTNSTKEIYSEYPINANLGGEDYCVRQMTQDDGPALLDFAQALPTHDTLYMRRDITCQTGIDKWLKDLWTGRIHSLIALRGDKVVGYSTINLTDLDWTSHIADLRVSTAVSARQHGLGRLLAREAFNLAIKLKLEKLIARMTPDQKGARTLFEELGFKPEAIFKDHVKDRKGEYHDMLIMAVNVKGFLTQREAFGR